MIKVIDLYPIDRLDMITNVIIFRVEIDQLQCYEN
jgi:hypothetical protein